MECLGILIALILLVAPFASFILGLKLRERIRDLEERQEGLDLLRRLNELEKQVAALRGGAPPASAAPVSERPPAAAPTAVPPVAAPPLAAPLVVAAAPVAEPVAEAAPPAPVVEPRAVPSPPPPAAAESPAPTPPPPRPEPRPAPPAAPPAPKPPFDWEKLIGVKFFSWIAGIALVVAAIFFLKYSVESGWLSPPVRLALGLLTGIGLLVGCELRAARHYRVTANALDAAGIAILFASFFAAHSLWGLIGAGVTFALLALVTAVAVLLSVRRDSLFIALLGLLGGFSTPALLSTGEDRPIALFSYLALLNLGLAWVALRKRWPVLLLVALTLTTLYQWGWVVRFLDAPRLGLGLGIFLLFPVLFAAAVFALGRRPEGEGEQQASQLFSNAAALALGLPCLLPLYLAAVPAYGAQYPLLFGFLALLSAGLATIAAWRGPAALHLFGAGSAVLVFWLWLGLSYRGSGAWPAVLGILAFFVLLFAAVPLLAKRLGRARFEDAGLYGTAAAPLLLLGAVALPALEPATASPVILFLTLFGLLAALLWTAVKLEIPVLYLASGVAVVLTQGIWLATRMAPDGLLAGLVVITGCGLAFLAAPFAARRLGATLAPWPSTAYLGLTAPLLLLVATTERGLASVGGPLVGAVLLLALAGVAAALALGEGLLTALVLAGLQLVLAAWVAEAELAPWPLAGSVAALALAGLGLFAFFAGRRRAFEGRQGLALLGGAAGAIVLGQIVTMVATAQSGAPAYGWVVVLQVAFVLLWLALAATSGRHEVAVAAVVPAAFAVFAWQVDHFAAARWAEELWFALALYLPFIAYPFVTSKRAPEAREPYLAAVLASAPMFFLGRHALMQGGWGSVIGILPVAQAAILSLLVWRLVRAEPPAERDTGRLATVAGAVLAFITVAIPLQLEKQWITVGWALLAAALTWLYRRLAHRGLLLWAAGLLVAVFVRLALNPAVLSYHPRGTLPIWNWYLYTYLMAAASCFLAVWLLRGREDRLLEGPRATPLFGALGTILLFLLLNIEIADFFSPGDTLTFGFLSGKSTLAEDLTTTIGWGAFALALLAAGLLLRQRAVRICAIALLSVTVFKAFLYDLSQLTGLYRVASFVGLAACLALVALLLQRFVLRRGEGET